MSSDTGQYCNPAVAGLQSPMTNAAGLSPRCLTDYLLLITAMDKNLIFHTIKDLPPFPEIALKVIQATKNPDYCAQDLVDIIEYDPSLTANVLKVANSAYFGLHAQVTSMRQAVAYLGATTIINILFLSGCSTYFRGDFSGYGTSGKQLLIHSISTAIMTRILGERIGIKDTSSIFTAGLLHDIGKIVLSTFVRDKYDDIMRLVGQNNYSFIMAEREVLGVDHAWVGGEMVKKWKIPLEIATPVALHHDLEKASSDDMATPLVYLADQVYVLVSGNRGDDRWCFTTFKQAMDRCRLTEADMDASMLILNETSKNIHQLLSI